MLPTVPVSNCPGAPRPSDARHRPGITARTGSLIILSVAISTLLPLFATPARATDLLFDDFGGPTLNPVWQASLPNNAYLGGVTTPCSYQGAPTYSFQSQDGATVLRATSSMSDYQRKGWSSTTTFTPTGFTYEARFNTLTQVNGVSIDNFIELWILDAANLNRYDFVTLSGSACAANRRFRTGSSIDVSATDAAASYQNTTVYRLVLSGSTTQNLKAQLLTDSGIELSSQSFSHSLSTYGSGFRIGVAQAMGAPTGEGCVSPYAADVALDFIRLTDTGTSTGSLQVTSSPLGASITIDGSATGQVTPFTFTVPAGSHTVTASGVCSTWSPSSCTANVPAGGSWACYFTGSSCPPPPVPAMPSWGGILATLAMAGLGAAWLRRRSRIPGDGT